MIASSAFFVLDAILNWPVSNYDGSWSQWGQMSNSSVNGGKLTSATWATDSLTENIIYNHNNGISNKTVELLTLDGSACTGILAVDGTETYVDSTGATCTPTSPDSDSTSGNQIQEEDALYMTP